MRDCVRACVCFCVFSLSLSPSPISLSISLSLFGYIYIVQYILQQMYTHQYQCTHIHTNIRTYTHTRTSSSLAHNFAYHKRVLPILVLIMSHPIVPVRDLERINIFPPIPVTPLTHYDTTVVCRKFGAKICNAVDTQYQTRLSALLRFVDQT